MNLLKLYLLFAKIGATTFGGGYAMLPILQKELVEKQQLTTQEELLDYYAISQTTPGVIAVNTATFIGYKLKGIKGAIVSTLGVITPSIIIITLIASLFAFFNNSTIFQKAFIGIRICVAALVLNAVINLWENSIIDKYTFALFISTLILALIVNISPIYFIIVATIITLLFAKRRK